MFLGGFGGRCRTKPHKVELFYDGNEADRTIYRRRYQKLSSPDKPVIERDSFGVLNLYQV